MGKLTKAQSLMVASCLKQDAPWVTQKDSENHGLLAGWADRGWTVEVEPPAPVPTLVAYQFTPAGRAALAAKEADGDQPS